MFTVTERLFLAKTSQIFCIQIWDTSVESFFFFGQQTQGPTRPQGFPTASCMLLAHSSWSYNHPTLQTRLKAFQSSFLLIPFVSERCLFLWRGLQPGVMLHSLHLECVHHLHITTVITTRLYGQMNKAHTSKRSQGFFWYWTAQTKTKQYKTCQISTVRLPCVYMQTGQAQNVVCWWQSTFQGPFRWWITLPS